MEQHTAGGGGPAPRWRRVRSAGAVTLLAGSLALFQLPHQDAAAGIVQVQRFSQAVEARPAAAGDESEQAAEGPDRESAPEPETDRIVALLERASELLGRVWRHEQATAPGRGYADDAHPAHDELSHWAASPDRDAWLEQVRRDLEGLTAPGSSETGEPSEREESPDEVLVEAVEETVASTTVPVDEVVSEVRDRSQDVADGVHELPPDPTPGESVAKVRDGVSRELGGDDPLELAEAWLEDLARGQHGRHECPDDEAVAALLAESHEHLLETSRSTAALEAGLEECDLVALLDGLLESDVDVRRLDDELLGGRG